MYLAKEGGRKRERERARHGVQWWLCEIDTFGNRVGKCGCVVERVRDRNMERKNERVSETDSFLRLCSVNPLPKRIGGDWQGLVHILT